MSSRPKRYALNLTAPEAEALWTMTNSVAALPDTMSTLFDSPAALAAATRAHRKVTQTMLAANEPDDKDRL